MSAKTAYPNLAAEMARAGMSVSDAAEHLQMSTTAVYKLMRGESGGFRIRDAKRLTEMFPGSTMDYLFDNERR